MSSNLYYMPANRPDELLPDELKRALRKLYQSKNSIDGIYGEALVPILYGMKAAGVKGAQQLIDAIDKYGTVELEEVW